MSRMGTRSLRLLGALLLLLPACEASITATPMGPKLPARPPGCAFEIYTVTPGAPVIEIGTIDVVDHSGAKLSVAELKAAIQPDVCKMGGDAAFASVDAEGGYSKATVLKIRAPSAGGPGSPAAACGNDGQCKGDRICVSGACVDPPTKPPGPR